MPLLGQVGSVMIMHMSIKSPPSQGKQAEQVQCLTYQDSFNSG